MPPTLTASREEQAAGSSTLRILVLRRLHDAQAAVGKLHKQGLLHAGSHKLGLVICPIEVDHQLSEVRVEQ